MSVGYRVGDIDEVEEPKRVIKLYRDAYSLGLGVLSLAELPSKLLSILQTPTV